MNYRQIYARKAEFSVIVATLLIMLERMNNMSISKKCDVCGKDFGFGFSVDVSLQGGMSFTNIAEHRFELGQKDVCTDCYYMIKKILKNCVSAKGGRCKMNSWISVKDSMPEQFTEVIIFTTKGNVTCAYLDEEDWRHEEDERVADWNIGEVTHWQPLPEPPKESVPMTNFEQIKEMSVEELAYFLHTVNLSLNDIIDWLESENNS